MSVSATDNAARRMAKMGRAGHAHDRATDRMDGYSANATDAAEAWGDLDSPEVKAAYITGCAAIHAAEVSARALREAAEEIYRGFCAVSGALHRVAATEEGKAVSLSHLDSAISDCGQAIASAVEVHSESIDRLADVVETLTP